MRTKVIPVVVLLTMGIVTPVEAAKRSVSYKQGYNYIMETEQYRLSGLSNVWGVNGQPVLRKVKQWCSVVPLYRYGAPRSEKEWSRGCVAATMTLRQYG